MPIQSSLLSVAKEFALANQYKEISFEAKGAFKETFRAVDNLDRVFAVKLLDPAKCNPARSEREINALKKCSSPLIAKLYSYGEFVSSSSGRYYFSVEEYFDGGTLSDQIANGKLSADLVRNSGRALIEALAHLKNLQLVHRDIKPDNIMFRKSEGIPVLVDFGLVRDLSESSLTQTWLPQGPGTPYYSAPEQLNNDKHLIGWRTDQFSVGVVLGISLTGEHPFERPGMTKAETVAAVARRSPCAPEFVNAMSLVGLQGIVKMLAPWPAHRYCNPNDLLKLFESEVTP